MIFAYVLGDVSVAAMTFITIDIGKNKENIKKRKLRLFRQKYVTIIRQKTVFTQNTL